jgi:hypothetical protein
MKRWAMVVAGLYVAILLVLTLPAVLAAFGGHQVGISESIKIFAAWQYWAWLALMFASQFALLMVPVRLASRRPITRGALWPTILAVGLMMGGLVAGAVWSLAELIFRDNAFDLFWTGWWPLVLILVVWSVWSVVFFRMSRNSDASDMVSRQCRALIKGSVLELLIAVPTHIVARYRDYCCAGIMTFIGLTMGISVMLFSYGPAVLFLYVDRWKKLHPKQGGLPACP